MVIVTIITMIIGILIVMVITIVAKSNRSSNNNSTNNAIANNNVITIQINSDNNKPKPIHGPQALNVKTSRGASGRVFPSRRFQLDP